MNLKNQFKIYSKIKNMILMRVHNEIIIYIQIFNI